jgi:hypothetical protein
MITLTEPQSPAAPADNLVPFFTHLRSANPFTPNRVNGPSAADVDVPTIHLRPFERLTALAREARDEGRGLGAVLWGEAGIGKSHLLSRLARWAERDKQGCFVYLHNLQANPDNLPRSLLKAVISILTQGRQQSFHDTLLFRLANAGVRAALEQAGRDRSTMASATRAFQQLVDRLCLVDSARAALVDRTVYQALFHFFRSEYHAYSENRDDGVAALAVRWLAGDFLDPAEARRLGLPPGPRRDEAVALVDNQQIKQVLVALTQLAQFRGQSFLLCLDQVDNLDDEQVAALARFLEALLDSAVNLLVVTSGVQATLVNYRPRGIIQSSAWDRLAQFEIGLQRISVAESRQILAERIKRFLEPLGNLESLEQLQRDPLFPLGEGWAQAFFRDKIELRPRDVLNGARAAWQREQEALDARGGPAWLAEWGRVPCPFPDGAAAVELTPEQIHEIIDRKVDQKMQEHKARLLAQPHTLPADGAHLSGLLQGLLEECLQGNDEPEGLRVERLPVPKNRPRPALDLLLSRRGPDAGQEMCTGVLCLVNASATSTAAFLRRLLDDERPLERLLLVTDERQPLQLGDQGLIYLAELRGRPRYRFQHIALTFAQYADLDALRAAVGLARSRDLEIEDTPGKTRPVSEEEVVASHRRQRRYATAPVLREVLAVKGEREQ